MILFDEIERIKNFTEELFTKDGRIQPILFGIFEGEKKIILLNFDVASNKTAFINKLLDLISQGKLTEYVFVAEAWMIKQDKDVDTDAVCNDYGSLKNHPKRQEVIVIQYCHPLQEIQFVCDINRGKDGEATLGVWEQLDSLKKNPSTRVGNMQSLFSIGRAEWN